MDFSDALKELKAGKKVARAGWNGKGMWVALTKPSSIDGYAAREGGAAKLAAQEGAQAINISGHLDLMSKRDGYQATIAIGWVPWTMDVLAEDWLVVE